MTVKKYGKITTIPKAGLGSKPKSVFSNFDEKHPLLYLKFVYNQLAWQ